LPDAFTDAVQQLAHEVVNGPVTDCVVHHPMGPRSGLQNSTAYKCCPSANVWRHCRPQSMPPPVGIVRTCRRPAVIASSWTF
jgi:hypothetical protein